MNITKLAVKHTNTADEHFKNLPEILPEMLGYSVLVKPIDIQEETKGGIILTDSTKDDVNHLMCVGLVIAMGDECFANTDSRGRVSYGDDGEILKNNPRYSVGDWVVWPKLAGVNFKYQDQNFKILNDDEPFMKVESPSNISSFYDF